MKKLLLAVMVVLFVSGCSSRVDNYDLGSNKVHSIDDITRVFNQMIVENGHNLNLAVPYDRITIAMSKHSQVFELSVLFYFVETSNWRGNYEYEAFNCMSEDSILFCQQSKVNVEIDEHVEEITLGDTIDFISEVDVDSLVDYLKDEYEIFYSDDIFVQFRFESFDNEVITEDTSDYYVEIYYDEDVYQTENNFVLNGMKLVVHVAFEIGDDQEAFKIYYE